MTRSLNDRFIKNLKSGVLVKILEVVHKDSTLDIQLRGNAIDIYYRGGTVLHLVENKENYNFSIDDNYFKDNQDISFSNAEEWVEQLPFIKQARDFHYTTDKNTAEREFQQLIIRTNNYERTSNSSDFFITDMEYDFKVSTVDKKNGQIDLIAIEWNSQQRNANSLKTKFAFIEVKFGNNAIKGGSSGLKDHLDDIREYLRKYPSEYKELVKDTLKIFKQKRELELYKFGKNGNGNEITQIDSKPYFIIILADYKNTKTNSLYDLIESIDVEKYKEYFDLRFSISSFMGYGLYSDCLLDKVDTLKHLESISHEKLNSTTT